MNHPYRVSARPIGTRGKPRGKLKTLGLKLLIMWKGSWKTRNWRCPYCKKHVLPRRGGMVIDPDPFFHMMYCAITMADKDRHRDNYYYAMADNIMAEDGL